MTDNSGNRFYEKLGVRRLINGASWRTVLGGSIMPPAVVQAMDEASRWFVDLNELNEKAGEVIARVTGAEAGLVTAGSAAGMVLEAAACMAGTDPARVRRLPDTTGMKNEIVIQRQHRVTYDRSFVAAGARLVEVGVNGPVKEWELHEAIGDRTAAVAIVVAGSKAGALPYPKVIEISHSHGVPVIVDAAAMLPPVENLTRFISMGADMVSFSGGKGVLGPQSTGILCGRADLMEAAYMNSAPNSDSIGRAAKVCKEEIAGLVTALEMFVDADHDAEMAGWRTKCAHIASALSGIPGVRAELDEAEPKMDEYQRTSPGVRVSLDGAWTGSGPQEIVERLAEGDPSVRVFDPDHRGVITVSPVNLQDGDEEILAERFRQVLTAGR